LGNSPLFQRMKDMYFTPKTGVPAVLREGTMGEAIFIVVIGILVSVVSDLIAPLGEAAASFSVVFFANALGNVFAWVVGTFIFYVLGKSLGGRGDYRTLFMMMGFSTSLGIFTGIIDMVFGVIGAQVSLRLAISGFFAVWQILILFYIVRETMKLTTGKAVTVAVVPVLVVILGLLFLAAQYHVNSGHFPL